MKKQVELLHQISKKKSRLIIGLMSGTSLDGLDIALCKITGNGIGTRIELLEFFTKKYTSLFIKEVEAIFSKEEINTLGLAILHKYIGKKCGQWVNECLELWGYKNTEIDLIASHGQTIFHAPLHLHRKRSIGHATLQIGDADQIAVTTGIITISDFRQKHIAAGGEGAPLAVYLDTVLFSNKESDVVLVNIGGISNFTYIKRNGKILTSDIGPGNKLMDEWTRQNYSMFTYDKDSFIAKKGKIIQPLLDELMNNDFFKIGFPKSTGAELFNIQYLTSALEKLRIATNNIEDIMATLNYFTAINIANAINKTITKRNETKIYFSGGGVRNPLLMDTIRKNTYCKNVHSTNEIGLNSDAKEGMIFALLANECVAGDTNNQLYRHQGILPTTMGKISFPV